MGTVLLLVRFHIDMPIDEVYAFVEPIIKAEAEGLCKKRLNALKETIGATELSIDISVY